MTLQHSEMCNQSGGITDEKRRNEFQIKHLKVLIAPVWPSIKIGHWQL